MKESVVMGDIWGCRPKGLVQLDHGGMANRGWVNKLVDSETSTPHTGSLFVDMVKDEDDDLVLS